MTQETSGRGVAAAANIEKVLRSISSASLGELMSIWRARAHEEGSGSPAVFRCLGERVLAQGEPLLAYDVVSAGLGIWPKDVRLRQLQGLALSRSGATERANAVLENLRREEETGEETLGMLGRTYKDLAATAATRKQRNEFLKRAAETYTQAYEATGGYWTGINAATMNLLIGETERAQELAREVRDECLEEIANPSGDRYWELAALGEASLILRDQSQAGEWYARAAKAGKNRFGDLHSSRRNARLILQHWNEDKGWIEQYLCIPCVLVFAGHMVDRPDRRTPRFPSELEPAVAKEIQRRIEIFKPGFGFASAACGSDILFCPRQCRFYSKLKVACAFRTRAHTIRARHHSIHGKDRDRRHFLRVLWSIAIGTCGHSLPATRQHIDPPGHLERKTGRWPRWRSQYR